MKCYKCGKIVSQLFIEVRADCRQRELSPRETVLSTADMKQFLKPVSEMRSEQRKKSMAANLEYKVDAKLRILMSQP